MAKAKKHVDWPAVEREYRKTDTSVRELAGWYQVDEAAIRYRAKRGGWTRPDPASPQPVPQPPPIVIVREPTALTAENTDPAAILERGRNLVIRLLDELDATTANLGEIEAAVAVETGNDENGRRRDAMLKAVSLKARADTLKALALAAKTLAETTAPEGKKAQRQAGAEKAASQGRFAVPQPPRSAMQ